MWIISLSNEVGQISPGHMANIGQEQPSIRNMQVVSSNRVHSTQSCEANKCRIFKPFFCLSDKRFPMLKIKKKNGLKIRHLSASHAWVEWTRFKETTCIFLMECNSWWILAIWRWPYYVSVPCYGRYSTTIQECWHWWYNLHHPLCFPPHPWHSLIQDYK